jgi:hypothetical protein
MIALLITAVVFFTVTAILWGIVFMALLEGSSTNGVGGLIMVGLGFSGLLTGGIGGGLLTLWLLYG